MEKQLQENAVRIFTENPDCNKLIGFSDGNIFFEKDKNFVAEHQRNTKQTPFEITREDVMEEEGAAKTSKKNSGKKTEE